MWPGSPQETSSKAKVNRSTPGRSSYTKRGRVTTVNSSQQKAKASPRQQGVGIKRDRRQPGKSIQQSRAAPRAQRKRPAPVASKLQERIEQRLVEKRKSLEPVEGPSLVTRAPFAPADKKVMKAAPGTPTDKKRGIKWSFRKGERVEITTTKAKYKEGEFGIVVDPGDNKATFCLVALDRGDGTPVRVGKMYLKPYGTTGNLAIASQKGQQLLATGTYIVLNSDLKTKSGAIIARGTQGVVSGPGDSDGAVEVEFEINDGAVEYVSRMDIRASWLTTLQFKVGITVLVRKKIETGTRGTIPVAAFGELSGVGARAGSWRLKTVADDGKTVYVDVTPGFFTRFDIEGGMTVVTRGEPIKMNRGLIDIGSFGVIMDQGSQKGTWRFKYLHPADGKFLQIDLATEDFRPFPLKFGMAVSLRKNVPTRQSGIVPIGTPGKISALGDTPGTWEIEITPPMQNNTKLRLDLTPFDFVPAKIG